MGGDERLRLFLALRLPTDALDEIERWQGAQFPRDIRVVRRDHLHVTLAFLGSRPAEEVEAIVETLRTAATRAGEIRLTPVRYRETRGVGMLVLDDADGNAATFAGDLHEGLERLGVYRREARPWLPHVTVARWRSRPYLRAEPPPDRTFVPSDAAAYLSQLRPGGAEYRVLQSVALGLTGGE